MATIRLRPKIDGITLEFIANDWLNNKIEIIPSGVPVNGQIGPHNLQPSTYKVSVFQLENDSLFEISNVEIRQNKNTGRVFLLKAPRTRPFAGRASLVFIADYA